MNPDTQNILSQITEAASKINKFQVLSYKLSSWFVGIILTMTMITVIVFIVIILTNYFNPFIMSKSTNRQTTSIADTTPKKHNPNQIKHHKLNSTSQPKLTLTPNYQTDAIGLIAVSKIIKTGSARYISDESLNANIKIGKNRQTLSHVPLNGLSANNNCHQQLEDALLIIRHAIQKKATSLEIVFTDPIVRDYAINLKPNDPIALQYAQEINELSKQIDIIFTNINAVAKQKIKKLDAYLVDDKTQ